jgi:hypothetical protein
LKIHGKPRAGTCLELKKHASLLVNHLKILISLIRRLLMKTPIVGVLAMVSIAAATLFFVTSREGMARNQHMTDTAGQEVSAPYHRYKLQYSYNGETWHDLITIENGELSKNMTYLKKSGRVPSLRYFYTYINDEGDRMAVSIPLTVEGPPGSKGRRA